MQNLIEKLNPFSQEKKTTKRTLKQRDEDYPYTGSCPVREKTGDGAPVGRCWFATYGEYCPRHGKLSNFLVLSGKKAPCQYKGIDENDLPACSEREFAPTEVFKNRR